jgi:hypothetical protein
MPKCPKPDCPGWVKPVDIEKVEPSDKMNQIVYKCDTCKYTEYHPFSGDLINENVNVPFEKLYLATPYEVYKDDIEKFFQDEILNRYQYWTRPDGLQVAKGFIWVASHGHFEALTVEPMDGNQFEIAVRFPHGEGKWEIPHTKTHKYSGYSISPEPFKFLGHDTGGH